MKPMLVDPVADGRPRAHVRRRARARSHHRRARLCCGRGACCQAEADTEPEREYDNDGEARGLEESAHGESGVSNDQRID